MSKYQEIELATVDFKKGSIEQNTNTLREIADYLLPERLQQLVEADTREWTNEVLVLRVHNPKAIFEADATDALDALNRIAAFGRAVGVIVRLPSHLLSVFEKRRLKGTWEELDTPVPGPGGTN